MPYRKRVQANTFSLTSFPIPTPLPSAIRRLTDLFVDCDSYRWWATRTGYSDRTFSSNPMNATGLVDEIWSRCTGPLRSRAFAAALPQITGDRDLAIKATTTMLQERRLPIARVAPLMEAVAQQRGLAAALELAEATLDYTMERGFLATMSKLSTAAGDDQAARLWQDRLQQVQEPGTPAPADPKRIAPQLEINRHGIARYAGTGAKRR